MLTITYLRREDPTIRSTEGAEQDWRNYVDSYVLVSSFALGACRGRARHHSNEDAELTYRRTRRKACLSGLMSLCSSGKSTISLMR
jgi:hypothetical protein